MFEQSPKEELLQLITEIEINPLATQRSLSEKLGFSLGKTNYIVKALIREGLVRHKNPAGAKKLNSVCYMLTKKGARQKSTLVCHFLHKKAAEYNILKAEWKKENALQSAGKALKRAKI